LETVSDADGSEAIRSPAHYLNLVCMNRQKLRIRFRKTGDLRLISHRDLARAFERMFRRAAMPLAMSEGFHPHPRINFPSALALGIEGRGEWVEVMLNESVNEELVQEQLTAHCPPGLEITGIWVLDLNHPKPKVVRMTYEIPVPAERMSGARQAIERFLQQDECLVMREGRPLPIDLRKALGDLTLVENHLRFSLLEVREAQARPYEILAALGLDDLEQNGVWLTRTEVELAPN
jgi:radical SAM-linked protein